MNFDSNRAWQEATAAIRASRSVVMPVAGVFFLVPSLAQSFFLGEVQARILAAFGKPDAMAAVFEADLGKFLLITLAGILASLIGYLAAIVLLTDHARPTVGEAIGSALRLLPTMIGATILGYLAMVVVMAALSILGGVLIAAMGSGGAVLLVIALLFALGLLATRWSLTMPVIVVENQRNPVTALMRSWVLTRGNTMRIFGFYALLLIAYLVIAVIVMVLVGIFAGLGSAGSTPSELTLIVTGIIGGALAAVVAVLVAAVIAAIHRQLTGLAKYSIDDTFG